MLLRFASILMVSLAASAAGAATPPAGKDWAGLLFQAIEANDCKMLERDAPLLLSPLGFEEAWTADVLADLVSEGRARLEMVGSMPVVTVQSKVCGS